MNPQNRAHLVVLCCALFFGACTGAATFSDSTTSTPQAPLDAPVVIPIQPWVQGLYTARVALNGVEASLIVDTGAGVTVMMPDVAAQAGCAPFGRVTGFRSRAERLDGPRCGPVEFAAGTYQVDQEVTVFDLSPLLQGAPLIDGEPVGGLLGMDVFRGRAVTVDHKGGHLIVETEESFRGRIRYLAELDARVQSTSGGASLSMFLAVEAEGGPLWMLIDSGNAGPVGLAPHALEQLGIDPSDVPEEITLEIRGLGATRVTAVAREMIYDGIFNAQFVQDHLLTLDFARGRAWGSSAAR